MDIEAKGTLMNLVNEVNDINSNYENNSGKNCFFIFHLNFRDNRK